MNLLRRFDALILLFLFPIIHVGCKSEENSSLPGNNIIEEANLLEIYENPGFDCVRILDSSGNEVSTFVIQYNDSARIDTGALKDAAIIKPPLKSLVSDSEVYTSALQELSNSNLVKGIFNGNYLSDSLMISKVKRGEVRDLGAPELPNIEKLVMLNPEVIILSFYEGVNVGGFDRVKIPRIMMYDSSEKDPLGRAEWLRLLGRLVGKRREADSIFQEEKRMYESEKKLSVRSKAPKILTEIMYEGVWYVPGGGSYQAELIRDAGGNYFRADDVSSGSLNMTSESVLTRGGDSDVWLIRFFGDGNQLKQVLQSNSIYKEFKAYKDGNIFFSDTSKSPLFREFPFHPSLLLHEYRLIFSGDTTQGFNYFEKLGSQ